MTARRQAFTACHEPRRVAPGHPACRWLRVSTNGRIPAASQELRHVATTLHQAPEADLAVAGSLFRHRCFRTGHAHPDRAVAVARTGYRPLGTGGRHALGRADHRIAPACPSGLSGRTRPRAGIQAADLRSLPGPRCALCQRKPGNPRHHLGRYRRQGGVGGAQRCDGHLRRRSTGRRPPERPAGGAAHPPRRGVAGLPRGQPGGLPRHHPARPARQRRPGRLHRPAVTGGPVARHAARRVHRPLQPDRGQRRQSRGVQQQFGQADRPPVDRRHQHRIAE